MRIAMIGYGLIGEAHACALRNASDAALTVLIGPPSPARDAFVARHGIADPRDDLKGVEQVADAVIVASPSECHFPQAVACLDAGLHVLAEIPPAGTPQELASLIDLAAQRGRVLQSTRTSAYLPIYRQVGKIVSAGAIGDPVSIHYHRAVPPRADAKKWADDALLHHAGHPLDLLREWFGGIEPLSCNVSPAYGPVQELALLARLGNAAPVSLVVSYGSRLSACDLTIVGSRHTLRASGFEALHSDNPDLCWRAGGEDQLLEAVALQDRRFVAACRGEKDERHLEGLRAIYDVIFEARRQAARHR